MKTVSVGKKMVDKLIECSSAEECAKNVEEAKLAKIISTENEKRHKCSSCTLYIVLFSIIFTINIGIATYFVYCKYWNCNKKNVSKYNYIYQATYH